MRCLDQHKTAWAHEKWNCGYTWSEIGDALHVSGKTVERCVKDMFGCSSRKRKRPALVYIPPIEVEVPEAVEFPEDF